MSTLSAFFVVSAVVLSCFALTAYGALFSSLHQTLVLNSSPTQGQVLQSGEGQVTVTWSLNKSNPGRTDSNYKRVKVKLCYAPISQVDRGWRKSDDNLKKDKSCKYNIVTMPYNSLNNNFTWIIDKDVPTATYFIRAYVYDSVGEEVAYGQTTDSHKKINLFHILAITGRHVTIDICAACFSAFSIISLVGFFFIEKRKTKTSHQK
ncbi:high-affinity nitrate transporter 3.1 [Nicotiana tabacum]|uniref:High-affinity nitrate transporter n=1 Tax=Nicotiana tabacum TaxID=4097 RepID=A0A1S4CBH5_TOBAC|nr:high-affinity nitrate transporter 3.1-like [Nicotiana tomentosiformis]XP_016498471.1 PREDICTED: high-affinity nitrate transporter 3.1-like [Nicotiana tabacum]